MAAVALGAVAKMGGGSPVSAAPCSGVLEWDGNEEGGPAFMDEAAAIAQVRTELFVYAASERGHLLDAWL